MPVDPSATTLAEPPQTGPQAQLASTSMPASALRGNRCVIHALPRTWGSTWATHCPLALLLHPTRNSSRLTVTLQPARGHCSWHPKPPGDRLSRQTLHPLLSPLLAAWKMVPPPSNAGLTVGQSHKLKMAVLETKEASLGREHQPRTLTPPPRTTCWVRKTEPVLGTDPAQSWPTGTRVWCAHDTHVSWVCQSLPPTLASFGLQGPR